VAIDGADGMKHYIVYMGARRDSELIGISELPDHWKGWIIYNGPSNYSSHVARISQAEYETYEVFGFTIYKYSKIGDVLPFRAIYDPNYWFVDGNNKLKRIELCP